MSSSTPGAAARTRRTSSRYWSAALVSPSPAMSAYIPASKARTALRHSNTRGLYGRFPNGALLDWKTPGISRKYGTMPAMRPSSRWALSCCLSRRRAASARRRSVMVIRMMTMRVTTVAQASAMVPMPVSQSVTPGALAGAGEGLEMTITRPDYESCPRKRGLLSKGRAVTAPHNSMCAETAPHQTAAYPQASGALAHTS